MQPGIADGFREAGRIEPSHLIAGEFPRITRYVTVTGGQALPEGAVLGQIAADKRYQLSDAAAADGSQTPDVILAEPVDTQKGDVQACVYLTGEFHFPVLMLGANHTLDSLLAAFRTRSLFLREVS